MAFLADRWPAFGRLFHRLFAPDWMHVLMHLGLYAVLAFLLATWQRPESPPRFVLGMLTILLVAFLHEALQILASGRWPGWQAEAFDLLVDLAGASLGWLGWRMFLQQTREQC